MRKILLKLSQENMGELSNVLIAILDLSVEKIVNIRLLVFRWSNLLIFSLYCFRYYVIQLYVVHFFKIYKFFVLILF